MLHEVIVLFLKANAAILVASYSAHAQMPHIMKCRGDLGIFCLKKDQWTGIKNAEGGLSVLESDCSMVRIGFESKKPYLEFNPWMGIQHKMFSSSYENSLNVSFKKHDEENISIQINSKTLSFKKYLKCMVSIDLKSSFQSKDQGPNSKEKK